MLLNFNSPPHDEDNLKGGSSSIANVKDQNSILRGSTGSSR